MAKKAQLGAVNVAIYLPYIKKYWLSEKQLVHHHESLGMPVHFGFYVAHV